MSVIPQLKEQIETLEKENTRVKAECIKLISLQANQHDQRFKCKNLVFYGIPGVTCELSQTAEEMVAKIFSKLWIKQRIVMAHRLGARENSPTLVQFACKPCTQSAAIPLIRRGWKDRSEIPSKHLLFNIRGLRTNFQQFLANDVGLSSSN